jgi:predicted CXXCH cytochrome family protein
MAPVNFQADCARCHPLFFDESIDAAAPHAEPTAVRRAMRDMLERYIAQHPGEVSNPQSAIRRVPLNFPRPPEPPARNAGEWVDRRLAFDERLMWNKTCAECHVVDTVATTNQDVMPGIAPYPRYLPSRVTARWMPRASFDHAAHQMVACTSCHAAESSRATQDVLMPSQAVCATCHAPSKGAETRCFECHQYHDWTKSRPVTPVWRLGDFK